jgi:hypothetical protein
MRKIEGFGKIFGSMSEAPETKPGGGLVFVGLVS